MTPKEIKEEVEAYGNDNMKFLIDTVLDFLANTNGMEATFYYSEETKDLNVTVSETYKPE